MRFQITALCAYAITFTFFVIRFFFIRKLNFSAARVSFTIHHSFDSGNSASYHKFSLFITNFRQIRLAEGLNFSQ
jgi:hypothetical protein